MSQRTANPAGIEDQLWPIVCATAVLTGVLTVVVLVNGDFDDPRLVFNGYTQLAAVAVFGATIVYLGSRVRGRVRRTAELAILLSLALHAAGGLSAVYLFNGPLSAPGSHAADGPATEAADDSPPPADYHWGRNDEEDQGQQAFEKPLETDVHDQAVTAAAVQPPDADRPVPATEVPRTAKRDAAPLDVAAAKVPNKPSDIRRPDAAKLEDLPPPETLAMARPNDRQVMVPDSAAPSPITVPEAPKKPSQSLEPQAVQAVKAQKYIWAKVAARSIDPNNASVPPPKMAADDAALSGELPSAKLLAKLPSPAATGPSAEKTGADSADEVSRRGSTLARDDRGASMPSSILPDAGVPAQLPAAAGGSQGSRLDRQSNVPVEGTDSAHAPLGPNVASAGSEEFAHGASLLPTRRGAIDGRGRGEPSLEGDVNSDLDELRAGSPGSNRSYGLVRSAAPARRAEASQTADGGADLVAGPNATLPRTAAEMGVMQPSATVVGDDPVLTGAGGAAARPGGQTSSLDVGQTIAVRRVGGGPLRGRSRGDAAPGDSAGEIYPASATSARGTGSDLVPGYPLAGHPPRIEHGSSEGDAIGVGGIPRSHGQVFDPRTTIDSVSPVSGTASTVQGPVQGAGPIGLSAQSIGPDDSLGGTGRDPQAVTPGPGQKFGARPAADAADVASVVSLAMPQPAGVADLQRQGDRQLDAVLSGEGSPGISHGRGEVAVNSSVHEPLDAFSHARGGAGLGDGAAGQLTEPAIENGLEYFARTQFPDGHWSLHEAPASIPRDRAWGREELHADTAATGLALLAYMAAGYTHQDEKYRQTVHRGIDWLIGHQAEDGNLSYHRSDPSYDRAADPTHFYSHGIATMALCEAYGMTQDRDLRGPAQKAIDFIVRSQDNVRGGWRYVAGHDSDTSVTGWQLMALRSAQMAGLNVPDETMRKIGHWLDLAQVSGGRYVYNPWNLDTEEERKGRDASPTMTAQAMIMRMYLGQDKNQDVLRQAAGYLQENLPDAAGHASMPSGSAMADCYFWYYATQAMYHMQGDYWKAWDSRVTPLLRAGQVERGPLRGSWNPADPPDRWGDVAGRHYVTAMRVLTLEFRYWHLPLFRELRRD